jgi:hypothetical protein
MSCGIAIATIDMHTPGDLLRAADEAQYAQKRQRRPAAPKPTVAEPARRRARRDLLA